MANTNKKRIAVIGAGWAGCAAAVTLSQQGHAVHLIEAARTLGGRARSVELHGKLLDNGQHILLGAYAACLQLMGSLGIDVKQAFLRLPLQMRYPHQTGMQFVAPKLPAPLHLLSALITAKGLDRDDKMALARFSTTARWMDWQLHNDCTVSELLVRYDQTERLCRLLWNPLCVAALNTPPERASAQVFLNVLRDSLGAKRAASDMLIPRLDLSSVLPDAAANYLTQHGGTVIKGLSIQTITQCPNQQWKLEELNHQLQSELRFDGIIVATSAEQCQRLLSKIQSDELGTPPKLDAKLNFDFDYETISTCYLQYADHIRLEQAFFALADNPLQNEWAQFIFDRGQLNSEHAGLMAVVVSASSTAVVQSHAHLSEAITQQISTQLKMPELRHPIWSQVITEKRATFSCTPALKRPSVTTTLPTLMIAGDFTAGDYPATLEAAVRSGINAAHAFH